jgi:hypothetical protein
MQDQYHLIVTEYDKESLCRGYAEVVMVGVVNMVRVSIDRVYLVLTCKEDLAANVIYRRCYDGVQPCYVSATLRREFPELAERLKNACVRVRLLLPWRRR